MSRTPGKYRGSKECLLVYCELLQAARYSGLTTYQAVAQLMGLLLSGNHMGKEVGWILGEIVEDELAQDRPMISAIVVGVSDKPGPGFYELARQLGKLTEKPPAAEEAFCDQEREAVYSAWKREFKA